MVQLLYSALILLTAVAIALVQSGYTTESKPLLCAALVVWCVQAVTLATPPLITLSMRTFKRIKLAVQNTFVDTISTSSLLSGFVTALLARSG